MEFLDQKLYIYDYIMKNETLINQIINYKLGETYSLAVAFTFLFLLSLLVIYIIFKTVKDEDIIMVSFIIAATIGTICFIVAITSWGSYYMWIKSPDIQAFNYVINNL